MDGAKTALRDGPYAAYAAGLRASAKLILLGALLIVALPSMARAATIAYPDMRVQVPQSEIAITYPTSTTRHLVFSHVSWNAGSGPFEMRQSYDPASGTIQEFQALYSLSSPGVWTFDHSIPIAGRPIWSPPEDEIFPYVAFSLYNVATNGGVGTLVATSPKTEFCWTAGIYVGGVPNTPSASAYDPNGCNSPSSTLGIDVGWGDKYDAGDGGEYIDMTNIPDGTYWLRAQEDPNHYFADANPSDKITDTKVQISGGTVTVLAQTNPSSTPPTVSVTNPSDGTTVAGTMNLTATAGGAAAIKSVQFLLDGQPLGSPVTSAPYTLPWTMGSLSPGIHYLSAQATDVNGVVGTAPVVTVYVASAPIGGIGFDRNISVSGKTTLSTPQFSTSSSGEVLLAFVSADGPFGAGRQTTTVSGGGLNWSLVKRSNGQSGDAEIWTATASAPLSNATVISQEGTPGYDQYMTVVALTGASGVGASAANSASPSAPSISLTTTQAGSAQFAVGADWDHAIARTLPAGQSLLGQSLDPAQDTYWSQFASSASSAAGQSVVLNDTAPTGDRWNMAAVEVLPGAAPPPPADTQPPSISIVNPTSGMTISGTANLNASASDNVAVASVQFSLDGKAIGQPITQAPYTLSFDTTMVANGSHTLTATATDTSGNVATSAAVPVTVQNPAPVSQCFITDVNTSVDGGGTVTTNPFTTATTGELLLAFVSSDGPYGGGKQSATVSGAGLNWTLVKRANSQPGDAEVWEATAAQPLSNVTVTSTPLVAGYHQSLTVLAMQMTNGTGAAVAGGATTGAPSVSLTTTHANSLVYGVGEDWDRAIARTVGPNQVLLHQYVDTSTGDTRWVQNTDLQAGPIGSVVTLNDTAPTTDHWNMVAVEIIGHAD